MTRLAATLRWSVLVACTLAACAFLVLVAMTLRT